MGKRKNKWIKLFLKCHAKQEYKLKKRQITQLNNMATCSAFFDAYNEASLGKPELEELLCRNQIEIVRLGSKMKDPSKRAFFAYKISELYIYNSENFVALQELLKKYLFDDSVFTRQNALLALYHFRQGKLVADAFELLSVKRMEHNRKLLENGLRDYAGDQEELAGKLMVSFNRMLPCYEVATVNYLSFLSLHKYDDFLREKLYNSQTDVDLQCSIIRLLSAERKEVNDSIILKKLEENIESDNWEIGAVAALSLQGTTLENAIPVLIKAVQSKYWYVRINSSKALATIHIPDKYVTSIFEIEDNYGVQELKYEMIKRKRRSKQ